jgi:hypothetical protein
MHVRVEGVLGTGLAGVVAKSAWQALNPSGNVDSEFFSDVSAFNFTLFAR